MRPLGLMLKWCEGRRVRQGDVITGIAFSPDGR